MWYVSKSVLLRIMDFEVVVRFYASERLSRPKNDRLRMTKSLRARIYLIVLGLDW